LSVSQRALREEVGAGLFTRERIIPIALGLVALVLVFLIVHDVLVPPTTGGTAVQFTTVSRGTVQSAVTGTGTVTPVTQQNVNFGTGGQITEIDVTVGQHVTRGQTLAKIDPTQLQQTLDQANNGLTSAQASLNSTVNGNSVTVAQHNLANAQQSLSDTQAQVNLTNSQDSSQQSSDQAQLNTDNGKVGPAQTALNTCLTTPPPSGQKQDCSSQQTALNQAQAAVASDTSKISQDQNKIASDQLSGQRSINQANNAITSAQDSLNSSETQRPSQVAQGQSSVSNAQIQVAQAQRNLNYATLTAPFDGTVLAVNNQVGDTVSGSSSGAGSSSSSSSSGSSGSGATGGGGGAGGGGAGGGGGTGGSGTGGSSTSSTGTGFIVLGDLSGFQIVAPFAEADASRVAANQTATITFDAINGLTLPAHVTQVAGTATVTSNVTNYNVTLVLDQIDSRLKSGMTANANVIVQQASNVLTLPNSVITHIGTAAFVTLLGRDGKTQTRTPIQTGAVGDTSTQISSGLNLGDRVVRPSLRTTGTAGAAGAGGAGFRGGGGGGLGGGTGVRIGGG
jgi:HlyD family secretion protein